MVIPPLLLLIFSCLCHFDHLLKLIYPVFSQTLYIVKPTPVYRVTIIQIKTSVQFFCLISLDKSCVIQGEFILKTHFEENQIFYLVSLIKTSALGWLKSCAQMSDLSVCLCPATFDPNWWLLSSVKLL